MENYYRIYSALTKAVSDEHLAIGVIKGSHDFSHALLVAQYAQIIAEGEGFSGDIKKLAWLAGLVHNTDRLYCDSIDERIRATLGNNLFLSEKEIDAIVNAVLVHSLKEIPAKFELDCGELALTIAVLLRDADKVANVNGLLVLRSAQNYSSLPAYDVIYGLNDPEATYSDPRSVAKDIWYSLEWRNPGWIVTKTAQNLAQPRFRLLEELLSDLDCVFREAGLSPWPLFYK